MENKRGKLESFSHLLRDRLRFSRCAVRKSRLGIIDAWTLGRVVYSLIRILHKLPVGHDLLHPSDWQVSSRVRDLARFERDNVSDSDSAASPECRRINGACPNNATFIFHRARLSFFIIIILSSEEDWLSARIEKPCVVVKPDVQESKSRFSFLGQKILERRSVDLLFCLFVFLCFLSFFFSSLLSFIHSFFLFFLSVSVCVYAWVHFSSSFPSSVSCCECLNLWVTEERTDVFGYNFFFWLWIIYNRIVRKIR